MPNIIYFFQDKL